MGSSDEVVMIVDQQNREIGTARRAEMREQRLIHRATYILVFNSAGELFVQKRTMTKDIYPGYYDVAAGGVVQAGESYEESARRELAEELGVTAELTHLFDHYHEETNNRVWGRVFACRHEGPFTLQAEEVESGRFLSLEQIMDESHKGNYCPDGIDILHRLPSSAAMRKL